MLKLKKRVEKGMGKGFSQRAHATAVPEPMECQSLTLEDQRSMVWPELFGAATDTHVLDACEGCGLPQEVTSQIQLDVVRTQPKKFAQAECDVLQQLLCCFAAHNPGVGYCQGMNNIASVFLQLSFDMATAFKGFSHMLEHYCAGYHSPDLSGYRRDVKVLQALSQRVLDEGTLQRIDGLDAPLDILALDHFLTLTARSWPLEATVRLWDLLLLKGSPALFASFLAILELYAPPLSEQAGAEEHEPAREFQQSMLSGLKGGDLDAIMARTWEFMEEMPQALIDSLREAVGKDVFC